MSDNPLIPESAQEMFRQAETNLDARIFKYSKSVEDSLRLNDFNLQEKAQVAPSLHHGYINCLYAERRNLEKLKRLREQTEEEFVAKYGKPDVPRYAIEAQISKSEDIVKLDNAIKKQKDVVQYLEEICKIMSGFNFNIKNAVEMAKLSNC